MDEKLTMLAEDTETIINYSKANIGEWTELYTTDKVIMKRYEKFMEKHPSMCKLLKEDKYSMTFSVHPKCVGIYPRALRTVNVTEEQRQANIERLRKFQAK